MSDPLRIGFVTGATPDKWARNWRDQRREPLELVPVTEADPARRHPRRQPRHGAGPAAGGPGRAALRAAVRRGCRSSPASREHMIAATDDEVSLADLVGREPRTPSRERVAGRKAEQLDWPPMTEQEAIETVAAGTGVVDPADVGGAAAPAQGRGDPGRLRPRARPRSHSSGGSSGTTRPRRRSSGSPRGGRRTPRAESAQPVTGYWSRMRIVITGASGNVGSALLRRLTADGGTTWSASPAGCPTWTFVRRGGLGRRSI